MTNEQIVKILCLILNIDIKKYKPFYDEYNKYSDEYFDKRFSLDRSYAYEFNNFKKRIRFVWYPNNSYITIFTNSIFISNINLNILKEKKVYHNSKEEKIQLEEIEKFANIIERKSKINKIRNKCKSN